MLARVGLIPRDLADIPYPTCPGCGAYGKAHRKPFRTKGQRSQLCQATRPGEVVSMDQLISPTAGFVPTHRGIPTTQRYVGATVFVDHYSDFTYVHLMTKLNAETTVEAKRAFERVAQSHGMTIRHYHSDNGLFDTKLFKESFHLKAVSWHPLSLTPHVILHPCPWTLPQLNNWHDPHHHSHF